jgi:hypothetical protein
MPPPSKARREQAAHQPSFDAACDKGRIRHRPGRNVCAHFQVSMP